ncbi:MAG TPA: nickel pincer cofactor biosynthesis protein LarB [Candidatus Polarisedimenticolia bacterium]|nr:nickel pincer cofactor biosynthesis protein LarB [Candidatus Polarisedimenticolia bacterium]
MEKKRIRALLQRLSDQQVGVEEALRQLRYLPFEDLGFAKIDHHRHLRRGLPEVIFGEGKAPHQIVSIVKSLSRAGEPVLVTRVPAEIFRLVRKARPGAVYHPEARSIVWKPRNWRSEKRRGIAVLAAGTSDIPVAEEAALTAELMGNQVDRIYDVGVAGLHRLLDHKERLLDARVLVVVAGMEGALPSVVAGLVDVPVIAVPTSIGYGAGSGGMAALLAMLNSCSGGVVVVNIDNGFGAGFSAGLINCQASDTPKRSSPPKKTRTRPARQG